MYKVKQISTLLTSHVVIMIINKLNMDMNLREHDGLGGGFSVMIGVITTCMVGKMSFLCQCPHAEWNCLTIADQSPKTAPTSETETSTITTIFNQ